MLYQKPLFLLLTLLTGGWLSTVAQAEPAVGDAMSVLSLRWSERSAEETSRRLHYAAQLVAGRKIQTNLGAMLRKDKEAFGKWSAPFKDEPLLKVRVIADYDEIRVINRELTDHIVENDVGEQEAIAIAYRHLDTLASAGLVDQKAFNAEDVQVGYGRIIEGSKDGKHKRDIITEYRVTFRPNVDGIQLANAGVRIAVHRSGALSGLRVGGVSIDKSAGELVKREVSREQADKMLLRTIPKGAKADIAWSRVMYVMPEDSEIATVEPAQVYAYSLKSESDGHEIVSRRKIVGVSLSQGDLVDYTAPNTRHESQKKTRDDVMM